MEWSIPVGGNTVKSTVSAAELGTVAVTVTLVPVGTALLGAVKVTPLLVVGGSPGPVQTALPGIPPKFTYSPTPRFNRDKLVSVKAGDQVVCVSR